MESRRFFVVVDDFDLLVCSVNNSCL